MDHHRCYSEYEAARLIGLTYEALVKRRKRGIGPQCGTGWPGGGPKYSLHDLAEYKRPRGCQPHVAPDISRLGQYLPEPEKNFPEVMTIENFEHEIAIAVSWIGEKCEEVALGVTPTGRIIIEIEGERLPDMTDKKTAVTTYNALVRAHRKASTKGQRPGEQPGRLGERVGVQDRHEQRKEPKG